MKTGKEDRRIRITKQAIKESLIELMQNYPINKISVKMLCETADINRSTFYAHYRDQFDLLEHIQQESLDGIRQYVMDKSFLTKQNEITIPILIEILEYVKENRTLYHVLLNHNDTQFQRGLMRIATEKTMEEIEEHNRIGEMEAKFIEMFEISGVISVMREWLNNGCLESPKYLAELTSRLLFQGISGFYEPD